MIKFLTSEKGLRPLYAASSMTTSVLVVSTRTAPVTLLPERSPQAQKRPNQQWPVPCPDLRVCNPLFVIRNGHFIFLSCLYAENKWINPLLVVGIFNLLLIFNFDKQPGTTRRRAYL